MTAEYLHCEQVVEMASDWMEGALSTADRVGLEVHLVTCAGCVAYIAQLKLSQQVLGRLDDEAPPPAIRRNLMDMFRRHHGTGETLADPDGPSEA